MTKRTQVIRFPVYTLITGLTIYLLLQGMFVGLPGISGSSEAREAQVVDIILREGSWILPLRNGIVPSKPPLYHWLAATLSWGIHDVSEYTARLTSQISAVACLFLVSLTAFRFSTIVSSFESARHPSRVALLAPAILSLTYGFYQMSCQAMVDMTFTACVWAALASVVLSIQVNSNSSRSISEFGRTLFWSCCAIGILARGPLGLLLPVALVGMAGWCAVGFRKTVLLFLRPSFGWLAFVVPVTWYYLAYQVGGDAFLERQLFFENIKRFSGGDFVNSQPWWFYIPSIVRTTVPWGVLLLGIVCSGKLRARTLSYPTSSELIRWLPLILLSTGVVLFSLSSGKRHSYLLPILPLVAIQLSIELSSLFERGGERARAQAYRVARVSEIVLLSMTALILVGIGTYGEFFLKSAGYLQDAYLATPLALARLGVLVAFCGLVAFVGFRRRLLTLYGSLWFLMVIVMTGAVATGSSIKAHLKGFNQMASTWLAAASEQDELAVFKHSFEEYFDPILYYVHRPVQILQLESVVKECRHSTVYLAKRSWLDAHEDLFPGSIVRVLTMRERLLTHRGSASRDLVVFRCSTLKAPSKKYEGTLMHNAAYSSRSSDDLALRASPFQMRFETAIR